MRFVQQNQRLDLGSSHNYQALPGYQPECGFCLVVVLGSCGYIYPALPSYQADHSSWSWVSVKKDRRGCPTDSPYPPPCLPDRQELGYPGRRSDTLSTFQRSPGGEEVLVVRRGSRKESSV